MTSSGSFLTAQKLLAEKALNALFKIRQGVNFSKLPLCSAMKIFETAIQPILTYGCEVWGAYTKLNFDQWDKTPIEKAHLRFCKLFLGLNRRASNHAARGELGRFPIQLIIIKHLLSYNCYINTKDDGSIVKQSIKIMAEITSTPANSYIKNLENILNFCDINCSNNPNFLTTTKTRNVILQLQNKYSEYWKNKINSSSRLVFYSKIKQNYERDPFLNEIKNYDVKRTYYKFRTSNHSLYIETGRYCNPIVPRENRLCAFCNANETEDEMHFLLKCSLYDDLRRKFFKRLKAVSDVDFTDYVNTIDLFTSFEPSLTTWLANYIHKCFLKRKEIKMEI